LRRNLGATPWDAGLREKIPDFVRLRRLDAVRRRETLALTPGRDRRGTDVAIDQVF
jgi:hypothetical protein